MRVIRMKGKEAYRTKMIPVYAKDELFFPVFEQAKQCLFEIMDACEDYDNAEASNSGSVVEIGSTALPVPSQSLNMRKRGYSNNIIAFCADRGHGKTSAMLSFGRALKQNKKFISAVSNSFSDSEKKNECIVQYNEFWKRNDARKTAFEACHFKVLESIDPTTLEADESILRVIISRMYTCFKDKQKECCGNGENHYYQNHLYKDVDDLQQKFVECNRLIDRLTSERKRPDDLLDDLDELGELSNSSQMKSHFYELVKAFLGYYFGDSRNDSGSASPIRNRYLVIQVDDTDMNMQQAYEIVDTLRKYCVIPHIILLLSTNLNQLEQLVEQHFIKGFQGSLTTRSRSNAEVLCHEMAERYIEKVLPGIHQIALPEIDYLLVHNVDTLKLEYEGKVPFSGEYQPMLLHALQKKIGIRFFVPKDYRHNLLPGTLRELTHFLSFLESLDDLELGTNSDNLQEAYCDDPIQMLLDYSIKNNAPDAAVAQLVAVWKKNLERFGGYFLNEWASLHLTPEQNEILQKLHTTSREGKKSTILKSMERYCSEKVQTASGDSASRYALSPVAQELCASGSTWEDVSTLLEIVRHLPRAEYDYCFIYALHFYLTYYETTLIAQDILSLRKALTAEEQIRSVNDFPSLAFLAEPVFPWKLMPSDRMETSFGKFLLSPAELAARLNHKPNFSAETKNTFECYCYTEEYLGLRRTFHPLQEGNIFKDSSPTKAPEKIYFDPFSPIGLFRFLERFGAPYKQKDEKTSVNAQTDLIWRLELCTNWDLLHEVCKRLRTKQEENIYNLNANNPLFYSSSIRMTQLRDTVNDLFREEVIPANWKDISFVEPKDCIRIYLANPEYIQLHARAFCTELAQMPPVPSLPQSSQFHHFVMDFETQLLRCTIKYGPLVVLNTIPFLKDICEACDDIISRTDALSKKLEEHPLPGADDSAKALINQLSKVLYQGIYRLKRRAADVLDSTELNTANAAQPSQQAPQSVALSANEAKSLKSSLKQAMTNALTSAMLAAIAPAQNGASGNAAAPAGAVDAIPGLLSAYKNIMEQIEQSSQETES